MPIMLCNVANMNIINNIWNSTNMAVEYVEERGRVGVVPLGRGGGAVICENHTSCFVY